MSREGAAAEGFALYRLVAEATQRAPGLRAALQVLRPSSGELGRDSENMAFRVLAAQQVVLDTITPLLQSYGRAHTAFAELCEGLEEYSALHAQGQEQSEQAVLLPLFQGYFAQVLALQRNSASFAVDGDAEIHSQMVSIFLWKATWVLREEGEGVFFKYVLCGVPKFPWYFPPFVKLVESFKLLVHVTQREAADAEKARALLLLAMAMGTHARLGATSPIKDLHPDIVCLLCTLCVTSAPGNHKSSTPNSVQQTMRWALG